MPKSHTYLSMRLYVEVVLIASSPVYMLWLAHHVAAFVQSTNYKFFVPPQLQRQLSSIDEEGPTMLLKLDRL